MIRKAYLVECFLYGYVGIYTVFYLAGVSLLWMR